MVGMRGGILEEVRSKYQALDLLGVPRTPRVQIDSKGKGCPGVTVKIRLMAPDKVGRSKSQLGRTRSCILRGRLRRKGNCKAQTWVRRHFLARKSHLIELVLLCELRYLKALSIL